MKTGKWNKALNIIQDFKYPVLNSQELGYILTQIKELYGFRSISKNNILEGLISNKLLKKGQIRSENEGKYAIYYSPESNIDIFDITAARSRSAYFSHYSALFINGLTLQIPKQLYLTNERKRNYSLTKNNLSQEAIDTAFRNPPRLTSNKRHYRGNTINWINGQYHNNLGVVQFRQIYLTTNLERTLLDITIRPFYSGGVTQVLEAFEYAKPKINIETFLQYYKKMFPIYPYHQAIGFYLEKAGYGEDVLTSIERFGIRYNFYLTYNMKFMDYSDRWQLFYPKGM